MQLGEYSHLLWQIRRRRAQHLWEDCWRVTLPGSNRSLPVRATRWRLITILPKDWQPPDRSLVCQQREVGQRRLPAQQGSVGT
jgi:hypothetical protein